MKNKNNKGVTLIALVVTIIILLILVGVVLSLTIGKSGIINNAEVAGEETNRETAKEKINLKITNSQMNSYANNQRMPTLQELADDFCEDNEIEYVTLTSKKIASIDKIEIGEKTSFFTKLKEYPYEFEINGSLQVASINGVKLLASNNSTPSKISIEQYNVVLLSGCGGQGYNIMDKLNNYKTLTVGSRTHEGIAGTTYWEIRGYYEDNEGKIKQENILYTTSPSNTIETFNIEKYNKIMFRVVCTATSSGLNWCYYYFNNIEIF